MPIYEYKCQKCSAVFEALGSRPRKARLPRVRLGKAEKARVVLRRGPRREKFPPIVRRGTARALVLRGMLLRALRRDKNGGNPAGGFWGGAGRPRALGVRGRGFPRPSAGGSARANGRENLHARAKKTSGNRRGPKRLLDKMGRAERPSTLAASDLISEKKRVDSLWNEYFAGESRDAESYAIYGKYLRATSNPTIAYAAFLKADALDPSMASVKHQLAVYEAENGQFAKAYRHFSEALGWRRTTPSICRKPRNS